MEDLEQNDGDLARAAALMEGHGALSDTLARARHYTQLARDSLDIFAAGKIKNALLEVVAFCAARTH